MTTTRVQFRVQKYMLHLFKVGDSMNYRLRDKRELKAKVVDINVKELLITIELPISHEDMRVTEEGVSKEITPCLGLLFHSEGPFVKVSDTTKGIF